MALKPKIGLSFISYTFLLNYLKSSSKLRCAVPLKSAMIPLYHVGHGFFYMYIYSCGDFLCYHLIFLNKVGLGNGHSHQACSVQEDGNERAVTGSTSTCYGN